MSDDFLRDLLADRLNEREGERPFLGSPAWQGHRTKLLDAAAHGIAAARLLLDVLDDLVEQQRGDDPEGTAGHDEDPARRPRQEPPAAIPLTYDVGAEADTTTTESAHDRQED